MWGDYIGDGLVRQFVRLTGVKYRDFFLLIIEKEKNFFSQWIREQVLSKAKASLSQKRPPSSESSRFSIWFIKAMVICLSCTCREDKRPIIGRIRLEYIAISWIKRGH
jgi:hypothetical protein